jgi:hypothetical protein
MGIKKPGSFSAKRQSVFFALCAESVSAAQVGLFHVIVLT